MNKSIRTIIVEDEPIAAGILKDYIDEVPFMELSGIGKDAFEALKILHEKQVELMFLDIHLPRLRGMDFLKTLRRPPKVIITTAYHEYALEAFDLDVVDYLLKPISFQRFLRAINKVHIDHSQTTEDLQHNPLKPHQFFNVNKKLVKVYFDEVLYLESIKDYTRIHLDGKIISVKGNLGDMYKQFRPHGFLRIHRSFVVSLNKISAYNPVKVEIGEQTLPIGRTYKAYVMKYLF